MPASALAATATPILSFNSEIAIAVVARMLLSPIACGSSAEQPELRQVFPVDEVVEDKADEEDGHENDRARQLRGLLTAIVGSDRAATGEQREGQLVTTLDPLTEQHRADHDQ